MPQTPEQPERVATAACPAAPRRRVAQREDRTAPSTGEAADARPFPGLSRGPLEADTMALQPLASHMQEGVQIFDQLHSQASVPLASPESPDLRMLQRLSDSVDELGALADRFIRPAALRRAAEDIIERGAAAIDAAFRDEERSLAHLRRPGSRHGLDPTEASHRTSVATAREVRAILGATSRVDSREAEAPRRNPATQADGKPGPPVGPRS